jgi:hypothetical protein
MTFGFPNEEIARCRLEIAQARARIQAGGGSFYDLLWLADWCLEWQILGKNDLAKPVEKAVENQ